MTRKTRSDGEGSIYPREDGKWVASISMGKDHTGKRMRKTRIASSKKQASIKLRELQEMARNNTIVVDDTITISGFSDLWIETILPSQVDRSTVQTYRYALQRWVLPHIGHFRLVAFTSQDFAHLQQTLLASGLSSATVRHARRTLSACLNQAVRMGNLRVNPVSAIPQTRSQGPGATKTKRLSQHEAQHMLTLLQNEDPMLDGFVCFALLRGLRRGEVLGLKWTDIDDDIVHIQRSLCEESVKAKDGSSVSQLRAKPPKTKTSIRDVTLNSRIHSALKRIRARQASDKLRNGPDWINEGYIFTTDLGEPFWPSNMYARFKRFLKKHDLPDMSVHDLRKSFANLSMEGDARLEQVSEALGHASVETTKSIYIGSVPKLAERAFDAFDTLIEKPRTIPLRATGENK